MCAVLANQKFEMELSTRPLSGIGSGSTTSKADSRSVVTMSIESRVDLVDVAHLAGVDLLQALQRGGVHGRAGGVV